MERKPAKRPKLTLDQYEQGVLAGDIGILSRAITLVENRPPRAPDPRPGTPHPPAAPHRRLHPR